MPFWQSIVGGKKSISIWFRTHWLQYNKKGSELSTQRTISEMLQRRYRYLWCCFRFTFKSGTSNFIDAHLRQKDKMQRIHCFTCPYIGNIKSLWFRQRHLDKNPKIFEFQFQTPIALHLVLARQLDRSKLSTPDPKTPSRLIIFKTTVVNIPNSLIISVEMSKKKH